MVSDSPLIEYDDIKIHSLEKKLVDDYCRHREMKESFSFELQKALEVFPVNMNRLHRYATRRGVSEEISVSLSSINENRIRMFSATQNYLATIPVLRAWVFGSFARGEETSNSDLDLLVDYDKDSRVSLLDIVRFKLDLEKIIGREVDLVSNGYLKPFAAASAERDKYLIYER